MDHSCRLEEWDQPPLFVLLRLFLVRLSDAACRLRRGSLPPSLTDVRRRGQRKEDRGWIILGVQSSQGNGGSEEEGGGDKKREKSGGKRGKVHRGMKGNCGKYKEPRWSSVNAIGEPSFCTRPLFTPRLKARAFWNP